MEQTTENLNGRAGELIETLADDAVRAADQKEPVAWSAEPVEPVQSVAPVAETPKPARVQTKTKPTAKKSSTRGSARTSTKSRPTRSRLAEEPVAGPALTHSPASEIPADQPAVAQPVPEIAGQAADIFFAVDIEIAVVNDDAEPADVEAQAEEIAVRVAGGKESGARLARDLHEIEVEVRNTDRPDEPGNELGDMAANSLRLIAENLGRMAEPQVRAVRGLLSRFDLEDYLDPDFWQGIGMILRYQVDSLYDLVKRRVNGEYQVDRFGMDREIIELVRPFNSFMYRTWWRTTTEGAGYLPADGRALIVANHSGILPWDATQISTAISEERDDLADRVVRPLYLNEFQHLPFVGQFLSAVGQVPALPENAAQLLEADELVCAFPEGARGAGKLFKDRYRLARFGRGGFVAAALRTGAPVVPVAVIGAEETYPVLANFEFLAKAFNMPYFPITPFFPWLGPLGLMPLPTRWKIIFCEPVPTAQYGPDAADDQLTVFMFSEQIRSTIQEVIDEQLAGRSSIF